MITIYFSIIILVIASLTLLQSYWTSSRFINVFILVYRWFNAFAKIGVFAIAMQCCSRKVSASQFTFYMTIGALGSMAGATLIGPIKENFSWEITFLSFAAMMVISAVILQFINLEQHAENLTEITENENLILSRAKPEYELTPQ